MTRIRCLHFRGAACAVLVALVCAAAASLHCAAQQPQARALEHDASAGISALQRWYVPATGLYDTAGWWNAGNAITVLSDYGQLTHRRKYRPILDHTFSAAQHTSEHFINKFYDDEGWWALAWISTYDLTGDAKYLSMAETIFDDMTGGWSDDVCGGGIWWSKDRDYKNAIANELFLSVAAHLANRSNNAERRATYLSWARREWTWFHASGMINAESLINDGLVSEHPSACVNNQKTTWSYNQGVILGGLVELSKADADPSLIPAAHAIARATLLHLSDAQGVLHDECEPHCGKDGVQFKGIFLRNLALLYQASPRDEYKTFAETNAASILAKSQNAAHQFGEVWSGPFTEGNAGSQSSAIDALLVAAKMAETPQPR